MWSQNEALLSLAAALEVQLAKQDKQAGRPSLEASLQGQVDSKWRLKATWTALWGPLERHLEATWKPF